MIQTEYLEFENVIGIVAALQLEKDEVLHVSLTKAIEQWYKYITSKECEEHTSFSEEMDEPDFQ